MSRCALGSVYNTYFMLVLTTARRILHTHLHSHLQTRLKDQRFACVYPLIWSPHPYCCLKERPKRLLHSTYAFSATRLSVLALKNVCNKCQHIESLPTSLCYALWLFTIYDRFYHLFVQMWCKWPSEWLPIRKTHICHSSVSFRVWPTNNPSNILGQLLICSYMALL